MSDKEQLKKVLTDCFKDIDKDHSGFIEQKELESLLKAYFSHPDCPAEYKNTPEAEIKKQCQDFIKEVDTSGDKKISLDEFLNFFLK
jgi:Ca2+-binding EF-hand superfamily protein